MKPKLTRKKPLQPNQTLPGARQYVEFYRYLEYYNFGPYYIDDIVLPKNIRLLYVKIINADNYKEIEKRPELKNYVDWWYLGSVYPKEATYFMWASYEVEANDKDCTAKYTIEERGFKELLELTGLSGGLDYCMSAQQAKCLFDSYSYLVNNCVLTDDCPSPDYYIIESMEVINVTELAETVPDIYETIKKKKGIMSKGDFSVVATIYCDVDAHGNYKDIKRMLLIELLNEYMVQMTNKTE